MFARIVLFCAIIDCLGACFILFCWFYISVSGFDNNIWKLIYGPISSLQSKSLSYCVHTLKRQSYFSNNMFQTKKKSNLLRLWLQRTIQIRFLVFCPFCILYLLYEIVIMNVMKLLQCLNRNYHCKILLPWNTGFSISINKL